MRTTFSLPCIDRLGQTASFDVECRFAAGVGAQPDTWNFRVRPGGATEMAEFFLLTVERLNDTDGRITGMAHHYGPDVRGKGIPDALIPEAAKQTGLAIQSSPTRGPGNVY